MKTDTLSFSIQTLDHINGIWLCAEKMGSENVIPLALFLDDGKREIFIKIMNSGLSAAHTKGIMGI